MSFYRGQDVVIKIAVGSVQTIFEQIRNCTVESSLNLIDTTCIGQSARTRMGGLEDYSIDFNLLPDSTLSTHEGLVEGAEFEWEGYFEGEAAEQLLLSGTAVIETIGRTGEADALVEMSVSAVCQVSTGLVKLQVAAQGVDAAGEAMVDASGEEMFFTGE